MGKAAAMQATPDMLGDDNRLKLIAGFIADLQKQLFELELLQTANMASDDMPIPGSNNALTYGHRRATLTLGIQEIEAKFPAEVEKLKENDVQSA